MPASQILEKLPFPAQMKGKGAVLWERGLLLGGQMDPFFLQLVAIIHFIISMMGYIKLKPNIFPWVFNCAPFCVKLSQ